MLGRNPTGQAAVDLNMILNPTMHLFTEVMSTEEIDITIYRTIFGESWCYACDGLPKAVLISILRDIFNLTCTKRLSEGYPISANEQTSPDLCIVYPQQSVTFSHNRSFPGGLNRTICNNLYKLLVKSIVSTCALSAAE